MSQILTLSDAKVALRYPNPTLASDDDAAIQWFIDAATAVAEYHCDSIVPKLYDENYDGGDSVIYLYHRPLYSIESVVENAGYISYDLQEQDITAPLVSSAGSEGGTAASSIWSFAVDDRQVGSISARTIGNALRCFAPGYRNVRVIYTAGTQAIPPQVKLAVIQLVQHWWQQSMLRTMATSGAFAAFDASVGAGYSREPDSTPIDFGVPFRLIQLLRSHGRMPIIG